MSTGLSRREFVGATGAAMAALGASSRGVAAAGTGATGFGFALPTYTKARVLRVFIGSHPAWPKPDLDLEAEAKRLREGIDRVTDAQDIEFVGNQLVRDTRSLAPLLAEHKDVDGILAVQVCMGTAPMLVMMTETGIPTIMYATPYSGHEWHIVPDMIRAGKPGSNRGRLHRPACT